MPTITKYQKIPKDVTTNNDLDYQFLRTKGIEYIEAMGGGLWTDLNDHDPGVSFLELISYAITDLGARLDMPIEDILASESDPELRNQFYRAEEILPSCPVTALDYRKLFLDIDGIRNCWILPYEQTLHVDCFNSLLSWNKFDDLEPEFQKEVTLQGLNCLLVDLEKDVVLGTVTIEIEKVYNENRNLCEDLVEVKTVETQSVAVCTSIQLDRTADEDIVHAQILDAIDQYFSPGVTHHSLKEMLSRGYRTDEVFEGPLLEKGFIDSTELQESELRSEVRLSDLMNIIMGIDGVDVISEITIQDCKNSTDGTDWLICLDPQTKPILAPTSEMPENPDCDLKSFFNYKKDVMPVAYNQENVQAELDRLQEERETQNALALVDQTLVVPQGEVLDISETTTIQNDLPETYGIGPYGLPPSSSVERKTVAMQLKGYLAFFDQVIGSYFAHLDKVKELLSFNSGTAPTYFTQAIKDIKHFDNLVNDYPTNDDVLLTEKLMSQFDDNITRRNEMLDHLLSRFAEKMSDYSFLMKQLYGATADLEIIISKEQFLQEYVELSSGRGKGYNCAIPDFWDTSNISGVQKRTSRLAGIRNYDRRHLWKTFVGITGSGPYEWTISDANSVEILKSTDASLNSPEETQENICFAIHNAMNTPYGSFPLDENDVNDGDVFGKVRINFSGVTDYQYSIIDPEEDDLLLQVLGEHPNLFATWAECRESIIEVLTFIKDKLVEEGMFLIEHILLRPPKTETDSAAFLPICADDCESNCDVDPYSFRVSVVLPGMNERFRNQDFRKFMENLIRAELPSHIIAKICWIGMRRSSRTDDVCELPLFEDAWKQFLLDKSTGSYNKQNLIDFNESLTHLHTIYPSGRLHDCDNEDFEESVILGRTNLGTTD